MLKVWIPGTADFRDNGLNNSSITNTGVTIDANGKIGNCLKFNNTGNLIGRPGPLSNDTNDWTFACWMKVNTVHTGCLFSDRSIVDNTGIAVFYKNTQWIVDDGVRWQFTPQNAIATNTWYHICVVRKKGIGKYLYINGVLDSSTATTETPTIVTTEAFAIGNSQSAPTTVTGNQFNGYLNDIRVYDHALSPKEIAEIAKGLVVHYTLSPVTPMQIFGEDFYYQDNHPIITGNPLQFKINDRLNINNVVVDIEPKQSGSGDSSPDNIRPITGISSFWLEHRGKNLWHNDDFIKGAVQKTDDGWYYATSTQWYNAFRLNAANHQYGLFGRSESLHWPRITISFDYYTPESVTTSGNRLNVYITYEGGISSTYTTCTSQESLGQVVHKTLTSKANAIVSHIYFTYGRSTTVYLKNFQIEFGTQATEFEDGVKSIYDVDFDTNAETVYGGSYNLTTGQLTVTHAKKVATSVIGVEGDKYAMVSLGSKGIIDEDLPQICNCLTYYQTGTASAITGGLFRCFDSDGYNRAHMIFKIDGISTKEEYDDYLQQLNDAGTPLEVIYGLTTPLTYQLTPQQLTTLNGLNNIYSNGDIITINDPRENMYGLNDNTEYDVSGYQNNSVKTGTFSHSSDTARYLSSTVFNGSNSYIEANSLPSETKTVSVWVKTSWASSSGYKFVFYDKGTGLAIGFADTRIITYVGSGKGGTGSAVQTSGKYLANEWNHIVVIKTGDKTRTVYVNGEQMPTTSNNYWVGDINKLLIGVRHISGNYKDYINGQISDFRAYVTPLTQDQILELYQTGQSLSNNGTLFGYELIEDGGG